MVSIRTCIRYTIMQANVPMKLKAWSLNTGTAAPIYTSHSNSIHSRPFTPYPQLYCISRRFDCIQVDQRIIAIAWNEMNSLDLSDSDACVVHENYSVPNEISECFDYSVCVFVLLDFLPIQKEKLHGR